MAQPTPVLFVLCEMLLLAKPRQGSLLPPAAPAWQAEPDWHECPRKLLGETCESCNGVCQYLSVEWARWAESRQRAGWYAGPGGNLCN